MKSSELVNSRVLYLDWVKLWKHGYSKIFSLLQRGLRLLRYGYRPQVIQASDRTNQTYWYAYYPLTGVSKFLTSEAEIQEWVNRMQEI